MASDLSMMTSSSPSYAQVKRSKWNSFARRELERLMPNGHPSQLLITDLYQTSSLPEKSKGKRQLIFKSFAQQVSSILKISAEEIVS